MPLIRAEKEALVENLISELENSRVSLIVAYTRLNMKANDDLRTKAFEQSGKIKMISNNLLKIILKKLKREIEIPEKTLALAYGFQDEVTAAKTLVQFGKETETLEILGGWIDNNFFDATQVKTLASLPGKEQLQAQVVGRLAGLIQGLVYNLNFPLQKFAYVVSAIDEAAMRRVSGGESSSSRTEAADSNKIDSNAVEAASEESKNI